ncbi:hypothetical protein GCM10009766_08590 [Microcella frigidaquae]
MPLPRSARATPSAYLRAVAGRPYADSTMTVRPCSKVACGEPAARTLTYVYAESMAVLGPLSVRREPHSYDLCERHSERLSAPNGWQIVRYSALGEVG